MVDAAPPPPVCKKLLPEREETDDGLIVVTLRGWPSMVGEATAASLFGCKLVLFVDVFPPANGGAVTLSGARRPSRLCVERWKFGLSPAWDTVSGARIYRLPGYPADLTS